MSGQVPVPLIRSGVTAVHRVTVQTGASLGHLRNRWVAAQHWTPLGICYRWLSVELGAALQWLAQGRLSAEDRASLRPLSQRGLSAEDWAALSSLRQTMTEDGTAGETAGETWHTHLIAISWWYMLDHGGNIMISSRALLEDGIVSGTKDVHRVLCMGTSTAECGLGQF